MDDNNYLSMFIATNDGKFTFYIQLLYTALYANHHLYNVMHLQFVFKLVTVAHSCPHAKYCGGALRAYVIHSIKEMQSSGIYETHSQEL